MKAFALLLAFPFLARADFSEDQYPASLDILPKIISSASAYGEPLRSRGDEHSAYYLRSVRYVGECKAPFGVVHVAELAFTRSGRPAHGHGYIVFLDSDFRVRALWRQNASGCFALDGTRLLLAGREVLDFTKPLNGGTIVVDGEAQKFPMWK